MINRRFFLTTLGAAVSAAVFDFAGNRCDDAPRLQALADAAWARGAVFVLKGGHYKLASTLVLRGPVDISGCLFDLPRNSCCVLIPAPHSHTSAAICGDLSDSSICWPEFWPDQGGFWE